MFITHCYYDYNDLLKRKKNYKQNKTETNKNNFIIRFRSTSLPRNFHQNCHCPPFKSTSGSGGGSGLTSSNRCKCR